MLESHNVTFCTLRHPHFFARSHSNVNICTLCWVAWQMLGNCGNGGERKVRVFYERKDPNIPYITPTYTIEISTKVILLWESFQRTSACFWRAFNKIQPAFGELLESFRRAFRELSESFWRACFQRAVVELSESFRRAFREFSDSFRRAFGQVFQGMCLCVCCFS